jgi:hypothetical protein
VWRAGPTAAVAVFLAGLAPPGAVAAPAAAHGSAVCTVGDPRLTEISGMVRTANGFVVVDDGSDLTSHWRIFFLDSRCAVTRAVGYPTPPRDTEDLARAPDGTLWVADIGDNRRNRQTVALWRLANGGSTPVLYRLRYPDGAHDAEALVLAGDGTPVIVTKDPEVAVLYQPAAALRAGGTVPLRRVGAFELPASGTSNPFSFAGHLVVTGGANSPDGTRVVLRTYADAFEFPVAGGDVVRAITTGTPRVIPLPDEPQGESVSYDQDGVSLLTVSEQRTAAPPTILRYPPREPQASASPARDPARAVPRRSGDGPGPSGPSHLSTVVGAVGLAGLALSAALALHLLRRR